MKKIILLCISAIMLAVAVMSGCASGPAVTNPVASGGDGFYAPGQAHQGGRATDPPEVNIKEITCVTQGEETAVEIMMLSGSRNSGKNEARIEHIPQYSVSCLPAPERLAVHIGGVSYYDFDYADPATEYTGLVKGAFDVKDSENCEITLYFQLAEESAFKVEETDHSIRITLRPTGSPAKKGFIATLDAFLADYPGMDALEDMGFSPVLCSDLYTKIMASKLFDTEEEAIGFKKQAQAGITDRIIRIEEFSSGQLPDYSTEVDAGDLADIKVIQKGSKALSLDVLIPEGSYLCTSPDGKALYYMEYESEQLTEDEIEFEEEFEGEMEPSSVQRLWTADRNGEAQQLEASDFSDIQKAAFSPSGRYIAVLNMEGGNRVLYVYDTQNKMPYNMGEEGLGSYTDDFVWDEKADRIYSLSGADDESVQLMVCDFAKEDGYEPEALEEQSILYGELGVAGGKLYVLDWSGDMEEVFSFDLGTGKREKLVNTSDFVLSPDGRHMAYLQPAQDDVVGNGEEEELDQNASAIVLLELDTMKKKVVAEKTYLQENGFCFTRDSARLYFNTSQTVREAGEETPSEGEEGLFCNYVYYYDIAGGKTILDFKANPENVYAGQGKGELYIPVSINTGGEDIDVVFIYDAYRDYAAE